MQRQEEAQQTLPLNPTMFWSLGRKKRPRTKLQKVLDNTQFKYKVMKLILSLLKQTFPEGCGDLCHTLENPEGVVKGLVKVPFQNGKSRKKGGGGGGS